MATIYEVAKEADVSPKTAARILIEGHRGRLHNRQRVLAAAEKLGYVPNKAANLKSGKSGLLGLIVPDIKNPSYPVFFQAMHDIASTYGYQILLSSTFGKRAEEAHALKLFELNRVEGLILNAAEGESDEDCDKILKRFIARGVPVIVAGRPARSLPADEIVLQNKLGVEKSTGYLLKIGRRNIAFISGAKDSVATKERYDGYAAALAKEGLSPHAALRSYGDFTAESGYRQALALLERNSHIDAIVATNDLLAFGAIRACQTKSLRVPQDVAVVGFDDIPLARVFSPMLTTLRQPTEETASDCVNLLLERIKNKDMSNPRRLSYEPELLIRESA